MLFLLLFAPSPGARPILAQAPPQGSPAQSEPLAESPALPRGKKLILKDGSFQVVRGYELQGDRVRYYSLERSAWEEIPAAQVDWEATRKAEADQVRRNQEALETARAAVQAAQAAEIDVDASIEVAPGLFLPPGEGMYLADGRAVFPLEQNEAQTRLDKRRLLTQVLVPVPVIPGRHTVQLPGTRAKFRIRNPGPEFYIRTEDAREPEIQLLQAKVKGDARQIESIDTFFGEQSSKANAIPLQHWKVAKGVYRLTLSQGLAPGEYALVEIIPDKGTNLYVWDFGVDAPDKKQ